MRRMASDERCGSRDGIVAEGSLNSGKDARCRDFPLAKCPFVSATGFPPSFTEESV